MPTAQQAALVASVAAVGTKWLRVDVPFNSVKPTVGSFNWYPDALIKQAVAHGMRVDALISYAPAWARLADGTPNPAAVAGFAAATATHLAALGVHTYEIWNEPNLSQNWGPRVSPAQYTAVLKAAYTAIKGVDPSATVLTGGLAPAPDAPDGSAMSPLTFVTNMYNSGAKGYFDAIASHPYSYPDLPQTPDSWNPFYNLPKIYQVMADHGDATKQIWLTEYGAPTAGSGAVTPTQQATMISSAFTTATAWPWAGPIFLFDWQDNTGDGAFGVITTNGTPKTAYTTLLNLR